MGIINKDILDQVSERESIIRKEQNDKNKEFIKSILSSILDCHDEVNDILDTFNYMRTNRLIDIIPDHIYYVKSKTSLYCPYFIIEDGYHKFIYSQNRICGGPLSYHDTKIEITSGVLEKECISILSNFFKEKRIEKQNIDKDNI